MTGSDNPEGPRDESLDLDLTNQGVGGEDLEPSDDSVVLPNRLRPIWNGPVGLAHEIVPHLLVGGVTRTEHLVVVGIAHRAKGGLPVELRFRAQKQNVANYDSAQTLAYTGRMETNPKNGDPFWVIHKARRRIVRTDTPGQASFEVTARLVGAGVSGVMKLQVK